MRTWRCYYLFPEIYGETVTIDRTMVYVDDQPGVAGLERMSAFIAGFWIDEDGGLVAGDNPRKLYWIPPSSICMISIIDLEDPDEPEPDDNVEAFPETI